MSKKKSILLTSVVASAVAVTGFCALNSGNFSSLVNADGNDNSIKFNLDDVTDIDVPNHTFKLVKEGALKDGGNFSSLTCGVASGGYSYRIAESNILSYKSSGSYVSFFLEFDFSHVSSVQSVVLEGIFDSSSKLTFGDECLNDGIFRIDSSIKWECRLIYVTVNYSC